MKTFSTIWKIISNKSKIVEFNFKSIYYKVKNKTSLLGLPNHNNCPYWFYEPFTKRHPFRKMILPESFSPVAEKSKSLYTIGLQSGKHHKGFPHKKETTPKLSLAVKYAYENMLCSPFSWKTRKIPGKSRRHVRCQFPPLNSRRIVFWGLLGTCCPDRTRRLASQLEVIFRGPFSLALRESKSKCSGKNVLRTVGHVPHQV